MNYHVLKVRRECIVWSIAFLSSGTVITSDSFGRVQFWDWQRGTLMESHTVSTSAVLSLAVSEVGKSLRVPPRAARARLGSCVLGQGCLGRSCLAGCLWAGRSRAGREAAGPCLPPGAALSFFPVCAHKPYPRFSRQKEDSIIVGTSTGATYQFQLLPVKMGSLEKRWVRTKPFQHHTHDVRAVAHSSTALISGGRTGCGHKEGLGLSPRYRFG